jgi:hypothetical protein
MEEMKRTKLRKKESPSIIRLFTEFTEGFLVHHLSHTAFAAHCGVP